MSEDWRKGRTRVKAEDFDRYFVRVSDDDGDWVIGELIKQFNLIRADQNSKVFKISRLEEEAKRDLKEADDLRFQLKQRDAQIIEYRELILHILQNQHTPTKLYTQCQECGQFRNPADRLRTS